MNGDDAGASRNLAVIPAVSKHALPRTGTKLQRRLWKSSHIPAVLEIGHHFDQFPVKQVDPVPFFRSR